MGSEEYPRRDCWRKVWRGKVNAVFRVEVLNAVVEGLDLNAARAKVRAVEAILRLLIKLRIKRELQEWRQSNKLIKGRAPGRTKKADCKKRS